MGAGGRLPSSPSTAGLVEEEGQDEESEDDEDDEVIRSRWGNDGVVLGGGGGRGGGETKVGGGGTKQEHSVSFSETGETTAATLNMRITQQQKSEYVERRGFPLFYFWDARTNF